MRHGEDALAVVLQRNYGVALTHHGVGNILKRAGLLKKRKGYQYDIVDCATRIKYKHIYPGVNPAYTVDFLEHAVQFFAPAFAFTGIQTDNGVEFTYDHLPQVKPETKAAPELWLEYPSAHTNRLVKPQWAHRAPAWYRQIPLQAADHQPS